MIKIYCKFTKRAENAGEVFQPFFCGMLFHREGKVFAEVIDMSAFSLYNNY